MKKIALILLLLLQSEMLMAQSLPSNAAPGESPVKYTDYVISKITKGLEDNQLPATLLVGGTIAFESKAYIEDSTSDVDCMLVFATRADLDAFLAKFSQEQLKDLFGFGQDFVPYTQDELNLFLQKPLQAVDLSGGIQGLRVTIRLTDRATILKQTVGEPFQVLSKIGNPKIVKSKSLMGDSVKIFLVNRTLDDSEHPSYIVLDKNYFPYNDTLVTGRITDYLITAKAISDKMKLFPELQSSIRKTFVSEVQSHGCLNAKSSPSQYLFYPELYSKKFKKNLDEDFEDIADDIDKDMVTCNRSPVANGYSIEMQLENFTATKTFDYKQVTADDKIGALPEDAHPMIIKGLHEFAKDADRLTLLPYCDAKNKLVSDSGEGKIVKMDKDQRLVPVYPFTIAPENDPMAILKQEKTLENLKQLYPNIMDPNYVDPEHRFSVGQFYEGKKLSDMLYKPYGEKANSIFLTMLKQDEILRNAYLNSLTAENMLIKDQPSQSLFYGKLTGHEMADWYEGKEVKLLDGSAMPFDELKMMKIIINGKEYSSLNQILEQAKQLLNPESLEGKVKVFGLVDNPASKILQLKKKKFASTEYRYSGVAHPSQDMAIRLYHDIYYDVVNPALARSKAEVSVAVDKENKTITINHNYQLEGDRQILLNLHLYSVLKPFLVIAAKDYKKDISQWQQILQSSIFTTGFFDKNLFNEGSQGWLALAVLVEISSPTLMGQPRSINDINFTCCQK